MEVYRELNPAVEYKRDQSPLTQADLASHHIILEGLHRLTSDWPVISEESGEIPFGQRSTWQRFWLVDPLDGTKEFLHRNGEFTVNIALIEDCCPILGVVAAPAMQKLYYAARGIGAWKDDAGSILPIRVGQTTNDPMRPMISRSHRSAAEDIRPWAGSGPHQCIPMGSSLKFCLVADGTAHLYPRLSPSMEWDTAAAQCVLEVAGGRVTDIQGNPMVYNKPSLLNPAFIARGDI